MHSIEINYLEDNATFSNLVISNTIQGISDKYQLEVMSKGTFIKGNFIHTSCLPVSHERHGIFLGFFLQETPVN